MRTKKEIKEGTNYARVSAKLRYYVEVSTEIGLLGFEALQGGPVSICADHYGAWFKNIDEVVQNQKHFVELVQGFLNTRKL